MKRLFAGHIPFAAVLALRFAIAGGIASAWELAAAQDVKIGSKTFTESIILSECATHLATDAGITARHVRQLGGTRILWSALQSGEIDLYPEYTGTIREELFSGVALPTVEAMRDKLAQSGIGMTRSLGFNNTYALGMKDDTAERMGIRAVSDLIRYPDLKFGFSSEFMDRSDGWPGLRSRYQLPQMQVKGMEHALAYRGLDAHQLDVTDVYSTDANIVLHDLRVLSDDLGYFPDYNAVFLYRQELQDRLPDYVARLESLAGMIDDSSMLDLNQRVELQHVSETRVAAEFLREKLNVDVEVNEDGRTTRILKTSLAHLWLVVTSLTVAICVALPLGIIAAKWPVQGWFIVGAAEIVQTIPGLAMLVFLGVGFAAVQLPSIGWFPVVVALYLYSLLPILRNTMTGLTSVPKTLLESATALGLSSWSRLWLIELPLASRSILAGIKTTAVINVGYAALGGLIGAGGYGQPIMTGLRLNDTGLMLEGAVPAAIMALAVKTGFELLERVVVPRGLRLK
ncbi:MAG: glycine betaine ABC transporter substrate-binding protein [Pirellulaceae bacterium]|nr:ABC transporter permease subunit [Planctomycetales bacterium]